MYLKSIKEKLKTKIDRLLIMEDEFVTKSNNSIFYKNQKIFSFSKDKIMYGTARVSPGRIDPFYHDEFKITIILNHENLKLLNSNLLKPPGGVYVIFYQLKDYVSNLNEIAIGSEESKIVDGTVFITRELYLTLNAIDKEERLDKKIRVKNRLIPFLKTELALTDIEEGETERDYGLLLKEIVSSKQLTSEDVVALTNQLEPGNDSKVVITQEIHKQTDWLLEKLRKIVDEPILTKKLAKDYGKEFFKYTKNSISGPEHLLEKILTEYGKNIIFGVPALLNTDKYVISELPKVQFDIILIDSLADVEIVELKRPDTHVLDFDSSRNKFYPSKALSVAIGQAERYITTLYKDNDPDVVINGIKIKEYIESEIGGAAELSITRPTAMIVIGTIHRIAKDYDDLTGKKPETREKYEKNMWKAYQELKNTHKNIKITTYSELIDGAELRLKG